MSDVLTFNQSIFGTRIRERRLSKKAKKAQSIELYCPEKSDVITYDDGYDVDCGAILQALGIAGAIGSFACSIILALDKKGLLPHKLNWFWKAALKICRFAGDVLAIAGGISSLINGGLFNFMSKILCKVGFEAEVAINVAEAAKVYVTLKDFSSIFD